MTTLFASLVVDLMVAGVVGLLILAVVNRRALANVFTAANAQVGKFGRAARDADPLAVYQEQIAKGTDKIAKGRSLLAKQNGELRAATREHEEAEQEVARLNNRIDSVTAAGDPNNTAEGYALQLADAEERLKDAKERLDAAKTASEGLAAEVEEGNRMVKDAERDVAQMGRKLEQSEWQKEQVSFANTFDPNAVATEMKAAREAVQRKIDENLGHGDADRQLNRQRQAEAADRALERSAKAKEILERRKKPVE